MKIDNGFVAYKHNYKLESTHSTYYQPASNAFNPNIAINNDIFTL